VSVTVAAFSLQRAPVAILEQDANGEWPDDLGRRPEGALLFDRSLGVTVVTQPRGWSDRDETQICLLISYVRLFTGGCASEPFLPTVAVALSEQLPLALRERFPTATALQFVLKDGRVFVYASNR